MPLNNNYPSQRTLNVAFFRHQKGRFEQVIGWLLMPLLVGSLAGCQSTTLVRSDNTQSRERDYRIEQVELLQSLDIAPDQARVFVQDGQHVANASQTNRYRAFCAFEVGSLSSQTRTLTPMLFTVSKTQPLMDEVVQSKAVQVASLRFAGLMDGGAPMVHSGYHFWFEPNTQGLRRLSCYGVFNEMPQVEAPSLEAIQLTLKGVAKLEVTPQPEQ